MKVRLGRILYASLVILCVWTFLSMWLQMIVIPSPSKTFQVMGDIFWDKLWPNLFASYYHLLVATLISIVRGTVIGIGCGLSKTLDRFIISLVDLLYPVPRAAFLPLFLIYFGLSNRSKIVLMVAVSIFYFIIPFHARVKSLPKNYYLIAQTLNLRGVQWIWHVVLPACQSDLFTAIKMTVGASMVTLFFAENISGSSGIAYYIMNAWGFSNYPAMYAGIVLVCVSGIIILMEVWLSPWKNELSK